MGQGGWANQQDENVVYKHELGLLVYLPLRNSFTHNLNNNIAISNMAFDAICLFILRMQINENRNK